MQRLDVEVLAKAREWLKSHTLWLCTVLNTYSKSRLERMKVIGGMSDKEIARIHAPIGLPINSKTPSEIALSVMADIVSKKIN
ncbi:XdhC family protein [Pantoea sp.]|uniref:XdhC family protein n=1 Tax=Pantoea sp. TaxID=69393 RepID=UPI0028B19295|nr:XdhC family protein [Pantoea sp.]